MFESAACVALALCVACAGTPPTVPPSVTDVTTATPVASTPTAAPKPREIPARPARDILLPERWQTLSDAEFDATLADWTKDGARLHLSDAALAELGRALGASDATSARAAVILGNTRDERAFEVLALRLEARVPDSGRDVSGDVVAAAACESVAPLGDALSRLEALAVGARPHPVLRVRVECALASLHAGRMVCVPFLLDLLREGTSTAVKNPSWRRLDVTDERTLRLQDRIAQAVSAAAEIECVYKSRGPLALREKEITRLAQLLQAQPAQK